MKSANWRHRRPLAVTYYNVVIVTENHLRFVIDHRIACKRLVIALQMYDTGTGSRHALRDAGTLSRTAVGARRNESGRQARFVEKKIAVI